MELSLDYSSFEVAVACASGYAGIAEALCSSTGGDYTLTGCSICAAETYGGYAKVFQGCCDSSAAAWISMYDGVSDYESSVANTAEARLEACAIACIEHKGGGWDTFLDSHGEPKGFILNIDPDGDKDGKCYCSSYNAASCTRVTTDNAIKYTRYDFRTVDTCSACASGRYQDEAGYTYADTHTFAHTHRPHAHINVNIGQVHVHVHTYTSYAYTHNVVTRSRTRTWMHVHM